MIQLEEKKEEKKRTFKKLAEPRKSVGYHQI